jgi:hypothetical protein
MNSTCGWYCLAFLYFVNAWQGRLRDLYTDASAFTDMFEDLNKSCDHLKNEFILKYFLRFSADPEKRTPVEQLKGISVKQQSNPESIMNENDDLKRHI